MKKVKIGIIGAGWIAKQHLEVIKAIDWMEVSAITSRTLSKAQILAKEYGIAACYDTVEDMMHNAGIDAIMVLVSADQMFDIGKKAIGYKLPVFLEKPAGLTPEQNAVLVELADKNSVNVMVGFNRRYYSVFKKGMDIIKQHGGLHGISVEGHERMWRIRESGAFSDNVMDHWIYANSTHTIDLLRFFGGEVLSVKNMVNCVREKKGDRFAGVIELSSGAIGQYLSFWYSPGGWKVTLYGEGATVEFKPLEKGFWTDKDFMTTEILPDEVDVKYKPGFYRQMEAFGNMVRNGSKDWPLCDIRDSLSTMMLAKELCADSKNPYQSRPENNRSK